jgi:phospholipase C
MPYKCLVALLAATIAAGCSTVATPSLPSGPSQTASVFLAAPPPPVKGSPIQHVIVVIQENRTFDNLFNGFPGADTVTRGRNHLGRPVALQPEGLEWQFDPSHTHANLVKEYNGGAMNGFDLDPCDYNPLGTGGHCSGFFAAPKNFAYSYVPFGEVQFLWILAGEFNGIGYGVADHMFSSRQVPSFAGHQSLIAGQTIAAGNPYGPEEGALTGYWGCTAPKRARVLQFGKVYSDKLTPGYPCYDYQTIGDLMDAKGVTWKYYTGTVGTSDGTLDAYQAVRHMRFGPDWKSKIVTPMTEIFSDIQHGTLPQVSFVTPPGPASDHAGFLTSGGPAWVTSLYITLTENRKLYANTALLVTWDDSGGWFDHVKPPSDAFGPLGFRVPLMVMNPYAVQGVTHRTHDFGSILHFIEKNWKLGSLGERDAVADDLGDMFNYRQKPIPPIVDFGHFPQARKTYTKAYFDAMLSDKRPVDDDR